MKLIIEPGLLVSLNSEVSGNTRYYREQLEAAHVTTNGFEQSVTEVTKIVRDPAEQKAAEKVRGKCRSLITSVCTKSRFGLLCPEDREPQLEDRVTSARTLSDDFNRDAVYTHVSFNVFWGVVAQDNVRATAAITTECQKLMEIMQLGLVELDVKKVRAACAKARQMEQMLSSDASLKVDIAVRVARQACKRIVKAGEAVVKEIDRNAIRNIGLARTSFLDLAVNGDDVDFDVPLLSFGRAVEV